MQTHVLWIRLQKWAFGYNLTESEERFSLRKGFQVDRRLHSRLIEVKVLLKLESLAALNKAKISQVVNVDWSLVCKALKGSRSSLNFIQSTMRSREICEAGRCLSA